MSPNDGYLTKFRRLTPVEKIVAIYSGTLDQKEPGKLRKLRIGWERGLTKGDLAEAVFGSDRLYNQTKIGLLVSAARNYWRGEGYVLGSEYRRVGKHKEWRYCLIDSSIGAAKVQKRHISLAAGNVKSAMANEPVFEEQGLLPAPMAERLKSYDILPALEEAESGYIGIIKAAKPKELSEAEKSEDTDKED
ncbi:hypothetical protein ES703_85745 [subsurface metagenome]